MTRSAFPPFGIAFEFDYSSRADALKWSLRSRLRPWFDKRSGPRGWIIGPFVCLWLSPYWTMGPNAFAIVHRKHEGSTVWGLAGFDLAGTAMLSSILVCSTLWIAAAWPISGFADPICLLVLIAVGALWFRSRFHDEADPILRFLGRLELPLEKSSRKRAKTASLDPLWDGLTLDVNGTATTKVVTPAVIQTAFEQLDSDDFLILSSAPQIYIQILAVDDLFILEKREGDARRHVRAVYADGRSGQSSSVGETFPADIALEALLAYVEGKPMPAVLAWEAL